MKQILVIVFFVLLLFCQNYTQVLAEDCYQVVKIVNVNITNYSPNLDGNKCDSATGGGAGTADGSGSFQMNNGRLRWVRSNGSGVEDYVFAQPTTDNVISWGDREKYGVVIPGFNSNKPILIRDHYATGNHANQMYLDLFVPCSEWGSAPTGNRSVQIVDLSKPTNNSSSCTIGTAGNSLTIGNPLTTGLEALLKWFFGLFTKTDYTINHRSSDEIKTDASDFGDLNDQQASREKRSFAGSKVSSYQNQVCLKGSVIKKVATGEDLNNPVVSKINLSGDNSCQLESPNQNSNGSTSVTYKDLAFYFIQTNQQFYCDDNGKNLINTDQSIINKVLGIGLTKADKSPVPTPTPIPNNLLTCYQYVYEDLYLSPKDSRGDDENTKKMSQIPLFSKNQTSGSQEDIQKQLNQISSFGNSSNDLYTLRPEKEK